MKIVFAAAALSLTMAMPAWAASVPVETAVAQGVTISKYQNRAGAIDWEQMKAAGISFAMIRMGYHNDADPYYAENMQAAAAHGIQTGVFFYTQALQVETAVSEAAYVLSQIKDYPVSYPVAYDVESQYLLDNGLSKQQITDQINAFCQVIAAAGYRPMVYGNNAWLTEHMDTAQIPYDIWYARYGTENAYPNMMIWQSTDSAAVSGITGNVCMEYAFADYSQLIPATGWRLINGVWYYYQNYQLVRDTTMEIEGVSYAFASDGSWIQ